MVTDPRIVAVSVFLVLLILPFTLLSDASYTQSNGQAYDHREDYVRWTDMLNTSRVREHLEFFSSLETRATGYPGNKLAASYIYDEFKRYGITNVTYDRFNVTVPISHGANVTFESGLVLNIHPLKQNFVVPSATPPEGIDGKLVYVGQGRLDDFREPIEGNIAIMDWDSDDNWINAAKLGADAVIFLHSDRPVSTNRMAAAIGYGMGGGGEGSGYGVGGRGVKYLPRTPLNFPRFYAEETESKTLREHVGERVNLRSTHVWETVESQNVMGFVEGENPEYSSLIHLVTAYYDSGSLVATYAPGAQEAAGISALLEYARVVQQEKPEMSVLFVAFGGHHQSIQGAFHFSSEYWWPAPNSTRRELGLRMYGNLLHIDISTGASSVYVTQYASGVFFAIAPENLNSYFDDIYSQIREYAPYGEQYDLHRMFGLLYGQLAEQTVEPYVFPTVRFQYDSVICNSQGARSLTFATAFDTRLYYDSPFDTIERVNFDNLDTQARLIYFILRSYLDDFVDFTRNSGIPIPVIDSKIEWQEVHQAWGNLTGTIVEWDKGKGFWTPLGKEKYGSNFPNPLAVLFESTLGREMERYTFADDEGRINFIGGLWFYTAGGYGAMADIRLEAYVIDPETGQILFAPDRGTHAYPGQFNVITIRSSTGDTPIGYFALFNASTMAIYDFYSPKSLYVSRSEAEGVAFGGAIPLNPSVLKVDTQVQPESWSFFQNPMKGVAIVAAKPGLPISLVAKRPGARYPELILSNSSSSSRLGYGYILKVGEQLSIVNSPLRFARDFYYINQERYETLAQATTQEEHMIAAYDLHLVVGTLISESTGKVESGDLVGAYADAVSAWSLSNSVYLRVRTMMEDSAYVVPFLAFLLIPFAFLAERLIFHSEGYKRIAVLIGVIASTLLFFGLLHPGFELAASPIAVIIGFSILILASPVLAIMLTDVTALIKSLRIRFLGRHEAEAARASTLIHSFSTGVENLRRRPLRTFLTLFAITVMVSGLVGFTSLSTITVTLNLPAPTGNPAFKGLYIHHTQWGRGFEDIGKQSREYITHTFKDAIFAPRAWRYTNYRHLETTAYMPYTGLFRIVAGNQTLHVRALLGLSAEEREVTNIHVTIVAGRWFLPSDRFTCIINEGQAEKLGVNATNFEPFILEIENMNFTVIGMVTNDIEYVADLDGESIMPLKYDFPPGLPNPWNIHLRHWETLIVDYPTSTLMGGTTVSLSVKFVNATTDAIAQYAKEFYSVLPLFTLYLNYEDQVFTYGAGNTFVLLGLQMQLIPMVLVTLAVFNILLGGVYERKRDIYIYSTVGLSPHHISVLFLSETLVYALLGGVVGYLIGIVQLKIIPILVPGFSQIINYSSGIVISAIGGAMLTTILSALYPAYVSSKLVTPSLERKWKIPTKPIGDSWEIPLPFIAQSEEEINSINNFLEEFLRAHMQPEAPVLSITALNRVEGTRTIRNRELPYSGLNVECRLSPYGLGVIQKMEVFATKTEPYRWEFFIIFNRIAGGTGDWTRLNRTVLNSFRQQFLVWGSLEPDEKQRYA